MRIIGNKTHGDLAEVAISEFINQFLSDKFISQHVGKDNYRKKNCEEDICVTCLEKEYNSAVLPISLKAYGKGPLQLSTDKNSDIYHLLCSMGKDIVDKEKINSILNTKEFNSLKSINIMPLIYEEKTEQCNIMVFDFEKAYKNTNRILYIDVNMYYDEETKSLKQGGGRKHPIYMFLDKNGKYICEVRYGGASANALQRGFWTNTVNACDYFTSVTSGWIKYTPNLDLVKLVALALNSQPSTHKKINQLLQQNLDNMKD